MTRLLFLLPLAIAAQTVTQVSNTSIVARVGVLECDYSGTPSFLPLQLHRTCSLGGAVFSSEDETLTASASSIAGTATPSVGSIGWLFSPLSSGGALFQVSAVVPNGIPVVRNGSFLLPVFAPTITSSLSASGTVGLPFTYQITATNNPTSYDATGLPSGLLLNTATGLISGIPSASAVSTVVISASNSAGIGTATLAITIAAPPPGQITRVQTKSGFGLYRNAISITPDIPTKTGNSVVVLVSCYYSGPGNAGVWSVSDGTNTYNSVALLVPPQQQMQAFLASNITGTAQPITITSTVQTYWIATVLEYSGVPSLDKSAQAFDASADTGYASGALTTAQASELILGFVHYNNSNTALATPDSPWTTVAATGDGAYQSQVVQEQIVNALGSFNATGHLALGMLHSAMAIAFKGQ